MRKLVNIDRLADFLLVLVGGAVALYNMVCYVLDEWLLYNCLEGKAFATSYYLNFKGCERFANIYLKGLLSGEFVFVTSIILIGFFTVMVALGSIEERGLNK